MVGTGNHDDAVVQERDPPDRLGQPCRQRAERDVDHALREQPRELVGVVHAEFHVQIVRPAGEQFDQAGRRVLGEERGSRQPHQPATSAGMADLLDRAVLQAEQFGRATGQSQPTRGEGQPRRSTGEEPVAQLLAQVPYVQRDSRFGYAQFPSGLLDRPKPNHGRERTKLSRSHSPLIVRLARPARTRRSELA